MANPNKAKGSAWEQAIADFFKQNGFGYAERRVQGGSADRGDISGLPGTVIECKNHREFKLSAWMDELRAEKDNAFAQTGAVVIKRRNHSVGKAFVVLELEDYVRLLL